MESPKKIIGIIFGSEIILFVPDMIVSVGAKGADTYAKEYTLKNNIPIIEFLSDYRKYGRKAPLIRNLQIVANCDFLLAFRDGKSRGTKFTIEYTEKKGISCQIMKCF